jgi:c-di-GMP-binding flagellar brake protein YcgR
VQEVITKLPRRIRFQFPKRITRFQRRQQPRAEVTGTVKFFPPGQIDNPMRGFIIDISSGGIHLSTKQVGMFNTGIRPEGRPLMMNISAEGGNEFMGIEGEIRRVKTDYDRPGFVNVQIQFKKMSPSTQQRIYQFVKRHV